ncbi:hypothetical protein AB1Y20_023000 [Prymnesium parvum]|uniref:triose-phosphate isomerase n=1 Tax=Prymnesium parvum TaxID=97485 RepID=A0AB34JE70_PRYPA
MLSLAISLLAFRAPFAPRTAHGLRPSPHRASPPQAVWYAAPQQRRPLIAGNWKLNPSTLAGAKALLQLLAANQRAVETSGRTDLPDVAIFPPFPFLAIALEMVQGTGIKVGAQNVGLEPGPGAFTGEVSASMIASMGCQYVLLGHSERRTVFKETDAQINQKVHLVLGEGLDVVLCVGETEEEYEMALLESVCALQLKKGLSGVQASQLSSIVIAYEPVWAIGTGATPTASAPPAKAHAIIRRLLGEMFTPELARGVVIQYGGSVTPESVDDLMRQPDIDGCLVGGASLVAEKLGRIIEYTPPHRPRDNPRVIQAREVVSCKNVLGESPVWSARHQSLYWVSAVEKEVWSWNLADAPCKWDFESTVGHVALRATGELVVGLEDRIIAFDPSTRYASTLALSPEPPGTTRPNDARVDREGQLVFGMYNNYHRAGVTAGVDNAGLYRLRADGRTEMILDYKFRVSNSICFSPDGRTLYFCDTPTRKVYAFDYSPIAQLSNRRLVYTQPSELPGGPDGAQTDAEGYVWLALSGAGQVVRVDPATGATEVVIALPVASPTSLTFGGAALDTIFITTRGPDGGGLYSVKCPFGIRGIAEPEVAI